MLDYASILRGGQSLVPDFRQQMMQDEANAFRREQIAEARAQRENAMAQQEAFQQDLLVAMNGGGPDAITRLMLKYPNLAEGIKPALDRMDEDRKRDMITRQGSIYSRAVNNDIPGAVSMLREEVEADRAAGTPDPMDEQILAALESGDAQQQKWATQLIGLNLRGLAGDSFDKVFGGAEQTNPVQKEYDWRAAQFGKAAADTWLAEQDTSLVTVEPGGSVYRKSDFLSPGANMGPTMGGYGGGTFDITGRGVAPRQPEGGDQSTAGGMPENGPIGSWIEQTAGLTASSRKRATGVPGTYHADDNARDFPTATVTENVAKGRRLKALFGDQFDVIYSETDKSGRHNDHVHVEPGPALGKRIRSRMGGAAHIKTKQQYDRLASGTQYIAPDGSLRRKP